jgi:hypothetical protein
MPELKIELNSEGKLTHLKNKPIHVAEIEMITALPQGMQSGRTSVAIIIPLKDGSYVYAETSLRLFQLATAAFTGKYGDET